MWRMLLLFISIFLMAFHVQALSIENQLAEIQKEEDKSILVAKLNTLLTNTSLNNSQRINILLVQARNYLALSHLKKASIAVQQAKELVKGENLSLQQAQVDKLMGIVFYYQGHYEDALPAYQNALAFFKSQNFSPDLAIKQANLLNNIALVQTKKR